MARGWIPDPRLLGWTAYSVDRENLTISAELHDGQMIDLNAEGEPCENLDDLAAFVKELFGAGAIRHLTMRDMLAEITTAQGGK